MSTIQIQKCPTAFCAPCSGTISEKDRNELRKHDEELESKVRESLREGSFWYGVGVYKKPRMLN